MTSIDLLPEFTDILAKHDLEGLIKIGCPKDEYAPEAKRILPQLGADTSVEQVTEKLHAVFSEMFGCPEYAYERPASDFAAAAAELRQAWSEAQHA